MIKVNQNKNDNPSMDTECIDIDYLIHDILIIKAESLKEPKIFAYAEYLEKQLLKIKRKEAVLSL